MIYAQIFNRFELPADILLSECAFEPGENVAAIRKLALTQNGLGTDDSIECRIYCNA